MANDQRLRRWVPWALIVVGGCLQYAYVNTKHPPTVLVVWSWIFSALWVILAVTLAVVGVYWVRDRRRGARLRH